ncbi:MAG: PAS domain-containing protein, partial [Anaerolineales bacterium]
MNDESQTHPLPEMDEQRFRALIENSSDGMALVDAEGCILYSSPSVSRLLGYSVEEFVGRNAFEFIHPDDHAHTGAVLANLVQQPRQSASAHYRIRHKDGAWRWNEAVGTNLLDEPTVRALVVNYRDITGRKQAEAALQESYALLQTVIESIGDAVYVKDQQGRYRFINTAGARVFDKTTAEVKGQDDRALFVPEDARRIITDDRAIMASRLTQTFEETVTVLGGVRTYLTTKGPHLDATGAVAGLIGISRDITEYKQADEALQESETRLRALLESAPVGILV